MFTLRQARYWTPKARALESKIKYPRSEGTQVEIVNQPAENIAQQHVYPTHMWSEGFTRLRKRGRFALQGELDQTLRMAPVSPIGLSAPLTGEPGAPQALISGHPILSGRRHWNSTKNWS